SATASGGTLHFMAPELLIPLASPPDFSNDPKPKARQTVAVDIWALGILIYQLLVLKHPFIGDLEQPKSITDKMMIQRILNDEPQELPAHFPESLRNLIKRMLLKNPTQRITAEQILNIPEVAARLQKK
ncbi:MAG: hypothetical protein EZS28_045027, partial [Streblomastix strix]